MNKQILIIGAGPGGLASAVLLAAQGVKVKILERLPVIGGRTSSIEADGYKFDLGPTFFLYPRVLEEFFRAAGTSLRAEVEMVRLDPNTGFSLGRGVNWIARRNLTAMERQIAALSPKDAPGFRHFLDENRTKLALMEPCLESAFLGWQDLVQARLLKMLPMLRPHQSVDTYLKRFFTDERVPARVLFSVEIPWDVPVPLPEFVLHPLLSGIRIRGLSPDWRLLRHHRRHGQGGGTS